jgi:anti-sigma factor RsiW
MALRWRRRDLVCRDAVQLMTDYLEGTLPARDAKRLEAHLMGCEHCTEYLAQLRLVIEAAGRPGPDDLSPEAIDELTQLYRRWRDDT